MVSHLILSLALLLFAQTPDPQAPLKTIEDGALDVIELFVPSLDSPTDLTVLIRPFDATTADLGTGGKDGKESRQQEAKTMQSEAPRVLAERFVATLQKSGPFKAARLMNADEKIPENSLIVEGKFVTIDPGSRVK